MATPLEEARTLLAGTRSGVLSTLGADGYPYGSLVAYALDPGGHPVLHLSALAEHTKNILKTPKASLIVTDIEKGDIQNSKRLTITADVLRAGPGDRAAGESYYARFPEARSYGETLDFAFFILKPLKIRYIGGLGRIHSFETL